MPVTICKQLTIFLPYIYVSIFLRKYKNNVVYQNQDISTIGQSKKMKKEAKALHSMDISYLRVHACRWDACLIVWVDKL